MPEPDHADDRPRVGVSACLLGEACRYDGTDKRHAWIVEALGARVELVPVCPEVEAGLGTPREPIRVERVAGALRIRRVESRDDLTARLEAWGEARIASLPPLDGYVLKARSPSCGRRDVPVHDEDGRVLDHDAGFFARQLRDAFPSLAVVTEDDLEVEARRQGFLLGVESAHRRRVG